MLFFFQSLSNGLIIGALYALSALGLTLILGLMNVVNFAHGELYIMGGILGWWTTSILGLSFLPGLLLVIIIMGIFGYLFDRVLIARVRDEGEEPGILLTIGVAIFVTNTALVLVGSAPLRVTQPLSNSVIDLGGIILTNNKVAAVGISIMAIAVTYWLIHKTRIGRAMRATFQDALAAELAGININRVYGYTFALGTILAAISGMLLGSLYSIQAAGGGIVTLKAFVIVILGGMGSFAGAIVGALILGVSEALWGGYISIGFSNIIGFVLVIGILLFRPYGLFHNMVDRA